MKKVLLNLIKLILFFGIGFGILYLVYQKENAAFHEQCVLDGVPLSECSLPQKLINDFASVNYFWIVTIMLVFTISNISRALRWNMLFHPMKIFPKTINAFLTIMLGYFANLGFPRIGEVIRAGTFAKYENIKMDKVLGTIVVDRVMDVICLLIVIGLALILEYDTMYEFVGPYLKSFFQGKTTLLMILGAVGILSILAVLLFRKALLNSGIGKKITGIFSGFADGIKSVGQLKSPASFVFHTIVIWVCYFLMAYLCFFAFEPTAHLGPVVGLMVFVFGAFGIVIPSPGGLGTYHFLVIACLTMYGISSDDALSYANINFFSLVLGCNVLLGLAALLLLPIINKDYKPITKELETVNV